MDSTQEAISSAAAWRDLIAATHASGRQAVVAITGGGSGAIAELLRVPGGSRLLIEAQVPYDARALATFLGYAPEQACNADTAVAMARRALRRAGELAPAGARPVGIGATAALVSDRPRRGEHRCFIATATGAGVDAVGIVLAKGRRDRAAEEDVVARAIVLMLARACGVAAPPPAHLLAPDDTCADVPAGGEDLIERIVAGSAERITVWPDGQIAGAGSPPALVLPGSFNPLHDGHVRLADVAQDIAGAAASFELSVVNVDKPPLTAPAVRERAAQFAWRAPLELTRVPTFVEKSRLFPEATFVIGADTAHRLVASTYYGGDEARMLAALAEIADRGGRFLVAVRLEASGAVHSLADVRVPQRFAHLFRPIPERQFRLDLSSTEMRTRRAQPR